MFDLNGSAAPETTRPLPWDHWSPARRQWTALSAAAGVFFLGGIAVVVLVWA